MMDDGESILCSTCGHAKSLHFHNGSGCGAFANDGKNTVCSCTSFTQGIATPDGCCFHVNPRMDEAPCLLGITRPCKRCSRYVIASCARASNCPLRPGSRCKGVACKSYKRRNEGT